MPARLELAALEINPFPLTVLFKEMARGQLDSGSGEGQSTNRKLSLFGRSGIERPIKASGLGSTWLRMAKVVEATKEWPIPRSLSLLVQLVAGLTRAAPYQRFTKRFMSKASLRRSIW